MTVGLAVAALIAGLHSTAANAQTAPPGDDCMSGPVCSFVLSARDIAALPPSVAAEFRDTRNYLDDGHGQHFAPGNNCASLALNAWGDRSYSGNLERDRHGFADPADVCGDMTRMIASNPRLHAYAPAQDRCEQGGYIVVPMFRPDPLLGLRAPITHLVRQLPDFENRFIEIRGPDREIAWIGRNVGNGRFVPATQVRTLSDYPDMTACSAICVRPERTLSAGLAASGGTR